MNDAKHTKGPWRADWDDNGQWYIEPLGISGKGLRGDSGDCIESANARLIAAAPEQNQALLDAPEMDCWADMTREELERVVEGYTKWFHGQRAESLRKAEGK